MTLEKVRIGVSVIWVFVALYIVTDLKVSWTTGPVLFVLGIIPPVALLLLWNHTPPSMWRRARDPRL